LAHWPLSSDVPKLKCVQFRISCFRFRTSVQSARILGRTLRFKKKLIDTNQKSDTNVCFRIWVANIFHSKLKNLKLLRTTPHFRSRSVSRPSYNTGMYIEFLSSHFKFQANQIKSNQIKSNQIKSNQIKSNQVKKNYSMDRQWYLGRSIPFFV
jgi:hypothetical protein